MLYNTSNEPQQNIGRGVLQRKTGISPQLFITDRSKAMLLLWFILIDNIRMFSVCR